ncbi:hypothetical protein F2Q70_00021034 [Brassica cretica]|uniref:Uncharacterized protein n=1 Tax=Brassica cretica TaxID=69181 RepID=A0A8S9GQ76_BRACR|nr:hypothetical protein F2Q70_00021034 [Brassica cretica]
MKPLDVLTRVEARRFPYPRCRGEVVDEVTRDERRGVLYPLARTARSDVLTRVEAREFPYPRCRSEVVDEVTRDERRGVLYPLARTAGVATVRRRECDAGWIRLSLPESKLIFSRILMF